MFVFDQIFLKSTEDINYLFKSFYFELNTNISPIYISDVTDYEEIEGTSTGSIKFRIEHGTIKDS